jgi:uncharacterized membrane protein YgcG
VTDLLDTDDVAVWVKVHGDLAGVHEQQGKILHLPRACPELEIASSGRLRVVTTRLQTTDRRLAEGRQHAGRSRGSSGMSAARGSMRGGLTSGGGASAFPWECS